MNFEAKLKKDVDQYLSNYTTKNMVKGDLRTIQRLKNWISNFEEIHELNEED